MKLVKICILSAAFFFAATLEAFAADVSEATFTPQGSEKYSPVSASSVEVYVFKPEFKYQIIGVVEGQGAIGECAGIFAAGDRPGCGYRGEGNRAGAIRDDGESRGAGRVGTVEDLL